jgi:hypothetical protein
MDQTPAPRHASVALVDTAVGSVDPANLSTPELESRLGRLAARIAAAECELLVLLAEFDARQGWGECGMRSAAHWLSWRTGLRLGVARERVRVARSLRHLPVVRAAFAEGRLSYCKVRALSRVATAPTEADLVEIALGASGAQLERIVRAWRTVLVAETSASSHVRRGVRRREEDDGSVVFTIRLPPEQAAVVDAAVSAARSTVVDDDGRPVETPEETALADLLTDDPPAIRAEADAVVLMAESFLASGPRGEPGGSTLVLVQAGLDVLTGAANPAEGVPAETPAADGTVAPVIDGEPVEQRSADRRPPAATLPSGQKLSPSTVLRMLCHSPARLMVHARDGRPLDLGRTRRHATAQQRLALRTRDVCCRFPGCTQRRRLVPHHTDWWSRGGRTDLDLLVLLCPTHHRAVHEVGYDVRALGGGRFSFHRPGGERIASAPSDPADGDALPAPDATPDTIAPTWGGDRLDLDHLIGGMAGDLLLMAGHRLTDIPYPALDLALRAAAAWPDPAPPPPWQVAPAA